jgi:hypothetical protein
VIITIYTNIVEVDRYMDFPEVRARLEVITNMIAFYEKEDNED